MVPDLYMQNHFGGTVDYMFNGKFGITGGAIHEFNPVKGRWETNPVFGPVIHLKRNKGFTASRLFHIFAFRKIT